MVGPVHFFTDNEYSKILDDVVIVCVDTLVVDQQGNFLLGKRKKLPIQDWWIFGGRMFAKESYVECARRGLERELQLICSEDPEVIGYYNLLWEKRAEEPVNNGCNVLLVAMKYTLQKDQAATLTEVEEHESIAWFPKKSDHIKKFHPYLQAVIEDAGLS